MYKRDLVKLRRQWRRDLRWYLRLVRRQKRNTKETENLFKKLNITIPKNKYQNLIKIFGKHKNNL